MANHIPEKWQVFGLVGVSIFMSTLDSSIVNLALPYIMSDLATDIPTVQWVVAGYLLTVSSLLLFFGRLSDTLGRQPVYVAGFAVFTTGSLFCGLAGSASTLVAARIFQGLGASMLMACSPALIIDAFAPQERGRALGIMGAVVAAGLTLGPLAGGLILSLFSWRFIFYINLPIGLAATAAGLVLLKGLPRGSREPLDKTGSVLLALTLCSLMIYLTRMPDWGAGSAGSIACLVLAVASLVGFVFNEKKAPHPLFDLDLLKIRLFTLPLLASVILFTGLFVMVFMMPFYLTFPCGFGAARTGGIMIVPFLCLLVVSPVAGSLADRLGSRALCTTGMGMLCLSLAGLLFLQPDTPVHIIVWPMALAGLGTALYISPNNTAIMGAVPAQRRGIASGAVATARNLGMVCGVALAGTLFSAAFPLNDPGLDTYTPDMAPAFMAGFRRVMAAGAVLAGIGIPVTFARGKEPDIT